jgi:hypothetical protein
VADSGKDPAGFIIAASVIVAGSTAIRDVHEGKPRAAPIVFGFLMAGALLIVGLGSSTFARGLAWMALVGAFVVNGPAVTGIVSGLSEPGTKAAVTTPNNAGASPAAGGA